MPKGTIKLISDRGFGFIQTAEGKNLFFYRKELEGVDYNSLSVVPDKRSKNRGGKKPDSI
jgi:cold shock CspA family protein